MGILGSIALACSRTKRTCLRMARLSLMHTYACCRQCPFGTVHSDKRAYVYVSVGSGSHRAYVQGLRAYVCQGHVEKEKETVGERGYTLIQACLRA
ncbi:hypothetical protein RJT34_12628 [Clitoria ternatea]|uniref:Uncharacterized protein n=1 Tax=Clitoria ternatea TaxID=43366 RepID=A0AAN9JP65_CLITE